MRCRKASEHKLKAVADPNVKVPQCGLQDVWTPKGNQVVWLCCHHLVCEKCKCVISELTPCPDNKDHMPQDRRWR